MRGFGALALIRSSTALSLGLLRNHPLRAATTRSDSLLSSTFRRITTLRTMESTGKHSAMGRSSSSSAVLETPEWFKPERVRCLTEATSPQTRGNPVVSLYFSRQERARHVRVYIHTSSGREHVHRDREHCYFCQVTDIRRRSTRCYLPFGCVPEATTLRVHISFCSLTRKCQTGRFKF